MPRQKKKQTPVLTVSHRTVSMRFIGWQKNLTESENGRRKLKADTLLNIHDWWGMVRHEDRPVAQKILCEMVENGTAALQILRQEIVKLNERQGQK
jgi:hypothetical protein